MKLKFHKKLYLCKNISDENIIIEKIKQNIDIYNLFLVCISLNNKNIFDIFSLNEAFKNIYKDREYIVVAMAYGKKEAFILVRNIFQDNINNINNIKQKFLKNK